MSSETTLISQRLVNRRGLRSGVSNETPSTIPLHGGDEVDESGMLSDSSSEGAASPPPSSCLDDLPAIQLGESPQSTDEWSFSSNHSETSTEQQQTSRYLTPSRVTDHGQPSTPLSAKRKAAPFSVKGYTPERPYITQRAGFRNTIIPGRSQHDGLTPSSSHPSPSIRPSPSFKTDNVKENYQNQGVAPVPGRSASSHSLERPERTDVPPKRSRVKPVEVNDAIDPNEAKRSVEIIRKNGLPPLPTSLTEFLQQNSSKNSPASKPPALPNNTPSNGDLPLSSRDSNKAGPAPRFIQPQHHDKKPVNDDVFKRPAEIDFRVRRNVEEQKENRDPIYPTIDMITGSNPFGREVVVSSLRYTILKEIGRGGTGTVYEVLSHRHQEKFALKCISIKNAEQQTEQNYINEIKLLRRLDKHDRIVRLWDYEVNRQQQIIYMVLEMGTIDFAHLLANQKGRPLNYHFIKLYWEQMLEAVEAIHQQKIVHSDLKPANFILVDGSLKLIDFGIAKAISNDTTNIHREQQVGTINYMSPEAFIQETDNANGRHLIKHGRPSDVWSLGCILYQMVYGYTPFHHLTTVLQKIAAITGPKFQISFPREIKDQGTLVTIDPSIHEVLQSCLQRDPRSRMTIPQLLQHHSLRPRSSADKKATLDELIQRAYELGMLGRSIKDDEHIERMTREVLDL